MTSPRYRRPPVGQAARLFLILALAWPAAALPAPPEPVRIGVLAKRGGDMALARWGPTAAYLGQAVAGHRFEVVPLGFDAIFRAAERGSVDFILANPAIYVAIEARLDASRMATLRNRAGGHALTRFGGVVVTRADHPRVKTLGDLAGVEFMAVDRHSLGGWLMTRRLLEGRGIEPDDLARLSFGGTHDAVIQAVLAGRVDAGTVRTDTIERMTREGLIDPDRLRVIHPRRVEGFPFRLSTPLYPEWPFARLPHADDDLTRRIALALLAMPPDSAAAVKGRNRGWTVPGNYRPVHALMEELRLAPYQQPGPFGWRDILRAYGHWVVAGTLALLVLAGLSLLLAALNRRLQASRTALAQARDHLEERVAARTAELAASERKYRGIINGAREGFFLIGPGGVMREVNQALCRLLGRAEGELVGRRPAELAADPESRRLIDKAPASEQTGGQGTEVTLLAAGGQPVPVLMQTTIMREENGTVCFSGAFVTDMRPYKAVEASLRRANRIQQALSRSNRALLKAESEQALLDEICRIVVEVAGYPLAWIGFRDDGEAGLPSVAWAGRAPTGVGELGRGCPPQTEADCPSLRAIGEGRPVILQDLARHPEAPGWAEEAAAAGLLAMAALPFRGEGFDGALVIFAEDPESFEREESGLLDELVGDLAFGLRSRRVQAERDQHLRQLRQSAAVFESSGEGVIITDPEERIVAVNRAFTAITGYSEDDVLGETPRLLSSGLQDEAFYRTLWESLREADFWQGEMWNRRKDGEVYPELLSISAVRDGEGTLTNYVAVFADITEVKRSQAELDFLANHDPLTELPNRRLFNERLLHALDQRQREGGSLAVLFLDLDDFKNVNDSLGHPTGDQLLKAVADRLSGRMRSGDTLARIGGDEFLVLLEGVDGAEGAAVAAQKLLDAFREAFPVDGRELSLAASLGISLFPGDGEDAETLIKNADAAVFRAKEAGRNQYQFYTAELTATASERLDLERGLRWALEHDQLEVHFQPQVELASGRIVGAEALLRWPHPEKGLISPARFIPVAEDTGMILPIGERVLAAACRRGREWREAGHALQRMAVNVSAVQVQRQDLPGLLRRIVGETGFDPVCLEVEVTEAIFLRETERAIEVLGELRDMGVETAIDDFGTGFSSLGYLKQLPVDTLKIDKSFVGDIPADANDAAIVRTIIAMGRSLGLQVVAEGVETEAQAAFLRAEGCALGQGYLYSAPVPADEFRKLLDDSEA
jgi:diguanylate cyclase (GGDEF)-like protein/PAS domain S-box-containing protein